MSTSLPLVEFHGPAIPGVSDPTKESFWVLRACVPEFRHRDDKAPQQERIHGIRTLLADVDVLTSESLKWRTPRMMTLHLIVGADGRFEEDQERFFIRLPRKTDDFQSNKGTGYRTFRKGSDVAVFQHVAAEPMYESGTWPDLDDKDMDVPPFRLVAGAIELLVKGNAAKWLGPLLGEEEQAVLRLTPDGIELDAKVRIPGSDAADGLDGRFLLFPTGDGTRLRLLPDRLRNRLEWERVWRGVTPAAEAEEVLAGLKIEARRDGLPPAFVWRAETSGAKITRLSKSVDIPAADLRVRLLSPKGRNGVDGEVTLEPEVFTLAPFDAKVVDKISDTWTEKPKLMLIAAMGASSAATRVIFDSRPSDAEVALASTSKNDVAHVCAHDEVALARALRAAYGFAEPLPGTPDADRPLLSAFVPLDDGWLQLPVPNVPPPDLTKDENLTVPRAIPNVLSGYLRFSQAGEIPAVLSAFPAVGSPKPEEFQVTEAPWVVTVEGAEAVSFAVGFNADLDNGTSVLIRGAASLMGPELSTRGLIWISADRPDVLESLPRIGAGAGMYLDVPLETFDIERNPTLQFTLHELRVSVAPRKAFDLVTRKKLSLSASFAVDTNAWKGLAEPGRRALADARRALGAKPETIEIEKVPLALPFPPVIWQRHETTPLAAEMPMTRGAASAVRPLESRDLVPFVIDETTANPLPLVHLAWDVDAVFPAPSRDGTRPLQRRSVAGWPWPGRELTALAEGIAFAAFGVPGAEVAFGDENASGDPWSQLRFALRYDLPALDEAFATASLPPQRPENALPEERETPPALPVPLAHDWPVMKRFWDEQNRSHQLARVHHSYLAAHRAIGNGNPKKTPIHDLVGGLFWETEVGFRNGAGEMPYGEVVVGDAANPLKGDDALLGVSGHFTFDGALKKVAPGTPKSLEVLGYAPESFFDDSDEADEAKKFLFDSRNTGMRPARKIADRLLWRELRIREPRMGDAALATLIAPVAVDGLFTLWFKDLPIVAGKFVPPSQAIDFSAWQDGRLPLSGFEWRLVPTAKLGNRDEIFERGRDRIPFFGFALEPLRLATCELELDGGKPTGTIANATIVARLHLGPASAGPADAGNLVAIGLSADGQGGLRITAFDGPALRFAFDAREGQQIERRIAIAGSVKWLTDKPSFTVSELRVSMFGTDQIFTGRVSLTPGDLATPVVISWTRQGSLAVTPGQGMFVIDSVRIETKVDETGESGAAALSIARRLLITPMGNDILAPPPPAVEMALGTGNDVGSVRIVKLSVPGSAARFTENHEALTLTVAADVEQGEILSGFPVQGRLSFGLIARLAAAVNGTMEITAGWLDGEFVTETESEENARVDLRRIAFQAERMLRPERTDGTPRAQWTGAMRLFGKLSLDSAIGWPGVEGVLEDVTDPVKTGTHIIKPDPSTFHVHHVEYVLDGHALPFDVAACIESGRADAAWAVPVASRHTLTGRTGKKVSFTAVETIAIGAARAIVPVLGEPNASKPELAFPDDPVTWAARHREVVEGGSVVNSKRVQGMVKAGVGRLATVLSGALGLPFRAAFGSSHTGVLLAGGFAGLIGAIDGDESPLLRLPVLAAFDDENPLAKPGFISGKTSADPVQVAWVDGRAARRIVATLRGAVTPSSSSESALRSALLAGSRTRSSAGLAPGETAMAILVEQHFDDKADNLTKGDLEKTPFFAAAMVGLARTIPLLQKLDSPVVLSLLAGHGIRDFARGLAAAIVTRKLPLANPEAEQERLRPHLATLGDDVVVHGWPGPAVAELEGVVPVALTAGPAFADHVQPRAVLVRTVHEGRSQYDAPPLPRGHERLRTTAPDARRAFAYARGYGLDPGPSPLRWLAGPEEGPTRPYRDEGFEADPEKPQGSGLAGLSRVMAMPFHASAGAPSEDLVWIAQTRAPVYLPLPIEGLESPAIPWLTPGTPRSRHVTSATLTETFEGLGPTVGDLQAILPTAATIASVGDRAGISLTRIARFESALPGVRPFDGLFPRFGRAAQGGSWSVRTERTPRPGPLPPNRGDEERDRRPCASPILAGEPLLALEGPADRVAGEAGEAGLPRWTVTFVAAQEWDGMVTESWDGTIRLHAQIDLGSVDEQLPPKNEVARTLFRLLLPQAGNTLLMRASLVIGDVVVPFRRLHVGKASDFEIEKTIRRAVVPLVLDARPSDASTQSSAALAAVGEAFLGATLPPVEVRLVLHPDSDREAVTTVPSVIALTTEASALPVGEARAPVTLRLPLAPVVRARGALPLVPTSLLFIDPAYDAGLSSAPAADRARISAKGEEARGELFAILYADRARVNRKASVTFMMDVAYEKKLDRREAEFVDAKAVDGDIVKKTASNEFDLVITVVAKSDGERRTLFVATPLAVPNPAFTPPPQPTVPLAGVCELPFASLVEKDGTAAKLEPGDVLELRVAESDERRVSVKVLGATTKTTDAVTLKTLHTTPIARTLRIVLTDEPVVEPPPALYAALVRRTAGKVRLSLPLYAQSPLPWRVDLRDAKSDFRRGLMRRAATFVWTLSRPRSERADTGVHVVKVDRNGQTHLPRDKAEFVTSRKL